MSAADLTAAADRDALLAALGFNAGPLKGELRRKVILDDAAALRPEMVKAREAADEAMANSAMWQWIVGERVEDSRSGLLGRIWRQMKNERRKRLDAETAEKRLRERIIALETALQPFAMVADEYERWQKMGSTTEERSVRFGYGRARFALPEFRQARTLLDGAVP